MNRKKVLFLVKSEKTPSSRIRVRDLSPFLEKNGIDVEIENIPKSFLKRRKLFKKAKNYDLTILQKRLFSFFEFSELRRNAKKLAFDFDDAVYMHNAVPSTDISDYHSSTRGKRFLRTVNGCDFVIAANEYLANYAKSIAPNVICEIIPSSVNSSQITPKSTYEIDDIPILGWVGSRVTARYLYLISDQLCELRKKHNFKLHLISDIDIKIKDLEIKNIKWDIKTENCEIRNFDIGIMPLSDDPFSRGKASYKLLQYMAAGVPSVASSVGMNIEVAGDNEFAYLADSSSKFVDAIEKLIIDESLRSEIGKNGRNKIEKLYSREVVAAKLQSAIIKSIEQ